MEFRWKSFCSYSWLAICLAALLGAPAKGDDKSAPVVSSEPVVSGGESTVSPVSWEANLDVSGIARSPFVDGKALGKVETLDTGVNAIGSYQATPGVSLRFGLDLDRHTFGMPDGAPLPDKLQAFHLTLGSDLQLGESWLVRYEIQPGFYGYDSAIRGRNFSYPMILGVSYFVDPDLQLVAGVSYNPERKYPVLPGVGFRWKVSADWVLDAVLPTPRIEYSLSKSVTLYAGGDLRGDTFRVSGDFGDARGIPKLDNAVVDYTEVRAGVGASWKINSVLTMEIECGCVLVDELDFDRADVRYRSLTTPPYGGISLKAAF